MIFRSVWLSGLVSSVAHNDHAIFIDDDWLAKPELANGLYDVNSIVIQAGIVFVRTQLRELPLFDLHGTTFPADKEAERFGRLAGRCDLLVVFWGDQVWFAEGSGVVSD